MLRIAGKHERKLKYQPNNLSTNLFVSILEKRMQTIKVKSDGTFECEVAVMIIDEGASYSAYCPSLELTTYGDSMEDAQQAFNERLEIFLEEMRESHSLHNELIRLGWNFTAHQVYQPENISIPTHLLNHSNRIIKRSFSVPVN